MQLKDLINLEDVNNKVCRKIQEKLKEKYSEEFEIRTLGGRIGNGTCDIVSFTCSPKGNDKIIFNAELKMNLRDFDDNYCERKECSKIEENIQNIFINNNIQSINRVRIEKDEIFTDIFINGEIPKEYRNIIFEAINNKYKDNNFVLFIYEIKSEEFNKYLENSKLLTKLKGIGLYYKDILKEYMVKINSNEIKIIM